MKTVTEVRDEANSIVLKPAADYYADAPSSFDGGCGSAEVAWMAKIQADALEYAAKLAQQETMTKTEFLLAMSLKYNELTKELYPDNLSADS